MKLPLIKVCLLYDVYILFKNLLIINNSYYQIAALLILLGLYHTRGHLDSLMLLLELITTNNATQHPVL
jgi:hypothetical protein